MTEEDFAYLRNTNTQPGPNAGRSIDPTKPGPDADRIAELERELRERENRYYGDNSIAMRANQSLIDDIRAELSRLRNEQPITSEMADAIEGRSAPAPSPESQDVRELREQLLDLSNAYLRLRELIPGAFDTPFGPSPETIWQVTENALKAALAQSSPPKGVEFSRGYTAGWRDGARNVLAQSDAQPVGWQLAPKEPTAGMLKNVASEEYEDDAIYIWQGMLAAAPAAPPRPDANQNNVLGGPLDPTVVASLPWGKRQAPIEVPSPVRLVAQSEPRPDASGLVSADEAAEIIQSETLAKDNAAHVHELLATIAALEKRIGDLEAENEERRDQIVSLQSQMFKERGRREEVEAEIIRLRGHHPAGLHHP